ncbi:MAG TPA: hypothetical protein VGN20_00440 [Mucilaginibacter sp.]|jgi:hypothetical protein
MKVQDAISAYDFLAKLDWVGVLGLIIAITLIIVFFVLSIADKLVDDKKTKRTLASLTAISVIICICILKHEADNNYDLLCRAGDIKQYMLGNNESSSGFIELAKNVNFLDKKPINSRINEIQELVQHFPDEFAVTTILYQTCTDDSVGIALINSETLKAFNDQNEKLYPLFKGEILNFMKGSHQDTLNYEYIRKLIDDRCSDNVLDMLVSKNSNLFISIFAPYNRYNKEEKRNEEGATYALKINSDSVEKVLWNKQ